MLTLFFQSHYLLRLFLIDHKKQIFSSHFTCLQVFDSEDHGLRQVNLIALLVNGCCDDWGVDNNRVIRVDCLAAQSDAGVFCGQVGTQVPVQDKGHPDLTCKTTHRNMKEVHTVIVDLNHDYRETQ